MFRVTIQVFKLYIQIWQKAYNTVNETGYPAALQEASCCIDIKVRGIKKR